MGNMQKKLQSGRKLQNAVGDLYRNPKPVPP